MFNFGEIFLENTTNVAQGEYLAEKLFCSDYNLSGFHIFQLKFQNNLLNKIHSPHLSLGRNFTLKWEHDYL